MEIDLVKEKQEILKRYRRLLKAARKTKSDIDKKMIRKAFDVALEAHKDMRRKSGEPYIYHPIAVAEIVADEIGLGTTSIVCALLHDTVEDTYITLEDIEEMFGKKVAVIIDGLTKISGVVDNSDPNYSIQAENFRKIMLTLSDDARVILVKLADRLHNMRTMEHMARHKQLKIAYETLFIYAPLAHRLGLNAIKSELENLAFSYTEPELYNEINQKLIDNQKKLNRYINKFSLPLINELTDRGFDFDIKGRPKSIYSIARKMKTKNVPFEEVYDIFAIRIILNATEENEKGACWGAYAVITDLYKPRPDRLRDWISTPKANGYEALHTTVMGQDGRWVEIQIRSKRMDEIAEKGLAAHWKYKSKGSSDSKLEDWISKIRSTLEHSEDNTLDFIDDLKLNLYIDEIFIFTPNGEMITLPKGSTVLDFAYEIHSNIGDHCIGAKANHQLVPLNYVLNTGEQLDILTSSKQMPKEEWVDIVKTAKAKNAIKNSLKRIKKKLSDEGKIKFQNIIDGLQILEDSELIVDLLHYFNLPSTSDFYYRVALKKIDKYLIKDFLEKRTDIKEQQKLAAESSDYKFEKGEVLLLGKNYKGPKYSLSKCCNPIPGDEVFGFLTAKDGIKIHTTNCPNAMHLQANFAFRSIKAKWETIEENQFLTGIKFKGTDDLGLLNKILLVISKQEKVNIKSVYFDAEFGIFEGTIMLYVNNTNQLDKLKEKLLVIDGIHEIKRVDTNVYSEED